MGNELYTGSGTPVRLKDSIGEGGEALVFDTSGSGLCAKVYGDDDGFVDRVDRWKHRKLQIMAQNPPDDPGGQENHTSFAWPQEVLYREPSGRRCVGFLMPLVDPETFLGLHTYKTPSSRRDKFNGFSWFNLFNVCFNLASALSALHEKGYCVGDINEENVLVDRQRTLITIIDCDSFQVRDPDTGDILPCPVGKPEYTAPELSQQADRYENMERTPESDAFALGILLFELLMENTSPYQGTGPALEDVPSKPAKLKKGIFPYTSENRGASPPPSAPPFEVLHPRLRDLFIRCFDEGHSRPNRRPSAGEWVHVLGSLRDNFQQCQNNDNHRFLGHLKECPWCKWSPPGVDDCFPSPYGQQVPSRVGGTSKKKQGKKRKRKKNTASTGTASAGTPKLEVEENRIQHEDLELGATRQGSITFSNVGGGSLQGSLKAKGGSWLRIDRTSIDPNQHRQKVRYRVDTSNLAYGDSPTAYIRISSNGGNHKIPVSVSVETPKEASKRWGTRVALSGIPVGALFGAVVSAVPLPAVSGVTAGFTVLGGSIVYSIMSAVAGAIIGAILGTFIESPGGCATAGGPIGFVIGLGSWFSKIGEASSLPHHYIEWSVNLGSGKYALLSAISWALLFATTGAIPAKWWAQIKSRGDDLKKRVAGVWMVVVILTILAGWAFSEQVGTRSFASAPNGGSTAEKTMESTTQNKKPQSPETEQEEAGQKHETSSNSDAEAAPPENSYSEESEDDASSETSVPANILSMDSPDELTVGEQATFSANVNDNQVASPLSYSWRFGDGVTATGLQVTHSYSEPGKYTVHFKASNQNTSDDASRTITVEKKPPTSLSFSPEATTTASMKGNRFTITVVSGKAVERKKGDTELTLQVRQKSENFDGKWVRWAHILDETYLDGPRGKAYEVNRAKSENLGGGRVQPGDTRTGTVVFHVNVPPHELGRVVLNFTYFPYEDNRKVRIPFSVR